MGDILFRFGRGHINITPEDDCSEGWSVSTGRFCCWPSLRKRSRHTIHIPPLGAIDCSEDLGNAELGRGGRYTEPFHEGLPFFFRSFCCTKEEGRWGCLVLFGVSCQALISSTGTLWLAVGCVSWLFGFSFWVFFSPLGFKNIGSSFWDCKTSSGECVPTLYFL